MIGKAAAISHGINDLRYITGESEHKNRRMSENKGECIRLCRAKRRKTEVKHPEKINRVCDNFIPEDLDAMGIWEMVKERSCERPDVKNDVIRIEISPAKENTEHFSMQDWQDLWREFAEEFDKQVIYDKDGKHVSPRTNISNSRSTVWLHEESDGEVPHLHAAVCRIDEDGNINNDHNIHLRAQRAAEIIARRRGWKTAKDKRGIHKETVSKDCLAVLKAMRHFSWGTYEQKLTEKGYKVNLKRDNAGVVVNYTLSKGRAWYKASELGTARNLTAKNIFETWDKMHAPVQETKRPLHNEEPMYNDDFFDFSKTPRKPEERVQTPQKPAASVQATRPRTSRTPYVPYPDYTCRTENRDKQTIVLGDNKYTRFIPKDVMEYFDNEFDYREVANWQPLTNLAMAYFTVLAMPQVAPTTGGGGGSSNDQGWGRDKDEDDLRFARRCAHAAIHKLGKKPKYGIHR